MAQRRNAKLEDPLQGLESEAEIPSWRQAIRSRLAPHRDPLSSMTILLAGLFLLNSVFSGSVLGLGGRKSQALGLLLPLVWFIFIAPTRSEFKTRLLAKNGERR
jgi:hypothetical protein